MWFWPNLRVFSSPYFDHDAGCDLPGGWEGSTHHFVLFASVLEHYA